jgi:hypothetical protein
MTRILLALFLLSVCGYAQFQFGVEAGVPLTNTLSATQSQPIALDAYSSQTKLLLIGPTIGFNLPGRFRIEADALYQRINYEHTFLLCSFQENCLYNYYQNFSSNRADRWQFPLLLQYRLKIPLLKPFVEVGPSFSLIRHSQSEFLQHSDYFDVPGQFHTFKYATPQLSELQHPVVVGVVAGLGAEFHRAFFHIRPEIRYTRWGTSQFSAASGYRSIDAIELSVTAPSLSSKRDQLDFVIGLTF